VRKMQNNISKLTDILSGIVPIVECTHKKGVEFETQHEVQAPSLQIVPSDKDDFFYVYATTNDHPEMYELMEQIIVRLRGTPYRFAGTESNLSKVAVVFRFSICTIDQCC
jgi:hypothetical protein